MTKDDGPCQRRRKMMGRGADGGCGTEEKHCPASRVPELKTPTRDALRASEPVEVSCSLGVDFYSQAFKALSYRSPFDTAETSASTAPTLPSGLVSLLAKHSESRKRHKKLHSDSNSKKKGSVDRPKNSNNIWVKSEEYFRDLSFSDVERLQQQSTVYNSLASSSYVSIPAAGNACTNDVNKQVDANASHSQEVDANASHTQEVHANASHTQEVHANASHSQAEAHADAFHSQEEPVDVNEEAQPMEIDSRDMLGSPSVATTSSPRQSHILSSVEWVLGSRNKTLLTTERPTKKRKVVEGNAGLQRLIAVQPCQSSSTICHFCSVGHTGDQLNQLVICGSCYVAVHQKCYGIQGDVDEHWMCSWCKRNHSAQDGQDLVENKPCALCPKSGGALKPVYGTTIGNKESMEFVHLFCSMWMPEVYVDDMRLMEPVLNVGGIKETRRKLICNICKVRHGTCVRCTEGACRTSFHPICAREAGYRLEVWGKLGSDDVELRAFCSKHSDISDGYCDQKGQSNVGFTSSNREHGEVLISDPNLPEHGSVRNSDNLACSAEQTDVKEASLDGHCEVKLNEPAFLDTPQRTGNDFVDTPQSWDLFLVLKKLIDRGKIRLTDLAAGIGISADSLSSTITDHHFSPELHVKVIKWLRDHSFMASSPKTTPVERVFTGEDDRGPDCDSDVVTVNESDVPVKSVPPRRRTISDVRNVRDHVGLTSIKDSDCESETLGELGLQQTDTEISTERVLRDFDSGILLKSQSQDAELQDSRIKSSAASECNLTVCNNGSYTDIKELEIGTELRGTISVNISPENPACPAVNTARHYGTHFGSEFGTYIHPYIQEKCNDAQCGDVRMLSEDCGGLRWPKLSSPDQPSNNGLWMEQHGINHFCMDVNNGCTGEVLEDLGEAKEKGIMDLNPEDEVEGEIVYFQCKLFGTTAAKKKYCDDLIQKIVKKLPHELELVRKLRWDSVLVNQYLHELREAKKLGRKEKRHKEAQAVLAAAAAAAAASSRTSSLRKDGVDESSQLPNEVKMDILWGRSRPLLSLPCMRETTSTPVPLKNMFEKQSDLLQLTSSFLKEDPRLCEICGRSETILNAVLSCSGCKVAVHLDCYRSVKETTGPWFCELCEDMSSSEGSRVLEATSMEVSHPRVECGLCGSANRGAFRKSSDGQWVHVFCAEWVFESTFRRGQVNHVGGLDSVVNGADVCSVCNRKFGVCIKCNVGDCRSTFHPSCAKSAGYYLSVRHVGGKMQHRAYCNKHSFEQAKLDNKKHRAEELYSLKQIRVELEKLRLICDRILRRERLKRDLVVCSHDLLSSKRDSVAYSSIVQSNSFPSETSSESATTSLRGHTDGSRSCSGVMQKSDDVTIDSTVSLKCRIKLPPSNDNDRRKDDNSSTSQPTLVSPRPTDRVSFGGKQIPFRASSIGRGNVLETGGKKLSRKHQLKEPLGKELVMTSDQATMKNQRLPKGYIYVPIDRLSNEQHQNTQDSSPCQEDKDG